MLGNFLIGLREGLEASLVVVILIAYLVKSGRRHLLPRIWAGVAVAIAVSLAFGALLTFGPQGLTFQAQEALGGTLSLVAVGFVTWMVFWMGRNARALSGELKGAVDRAADAGRASLALVALLAVGREGLETALFLWSATQTATGTGAGTGTGQSSQVGPLLAALAGILVAVAMGYAFYRGVLQINLSRFFTWTGVLLIVIAAGVAAYGVHDLQEAGLLPGLNDLLFDVSATIPLDSWYGTLLKGVFNFSPATTKLQGLVWVVYLVPTMTFFLRQALRPRASAATSPRTPSPAAH